MKRRTKEEARAIGQKEIDRILSQFGKPSIPLKITADRLGAPTNLAVCRFFLGKPFVIIFRPRHAMHLELIDFIDIIRHEVAHSIAGFNAGHGSAFQEVCKQIKCVAEKCIKEDYVKIAFSKYTYTCINCGREIYKTRKVRVNHSCGECSRSYNPKYLLKLKEV